MLTPVAVLEAMKQLYKQEVSRTFKTHNQQDLYNLPLSSKMRTSQTPQESLQRDQPRAAETACAHQIHVWPIEVIAMRPQAG